MKHSTLSLALLITMGILSNCNFLQSSMLTPTVASSIEKDPADCNRLALTAEECTNSGTHKYATSTKILFDHDGKTCEPDNTNIVVSIDFSDHDTFRYKDANGIEMGFTRKKENRFEGTLAQPGGEFEWRTSIVFTNEGFIWEADSYYTKENLHLCKYLWTKSIVSER